LRWLLRQAEVQSTGATHIEQTRRSLARPQAVELIWRSPYPKRLKPGQQKAYAWRPSYLGFAFCGIAIDAISAEYT
jgi:hypothetical protein